MEFLCPKSRLCLIIFLYHTTSSNSMLPVITSRRMKIQWFFPQGSCYRCALVSFFPFVKLKQYFKYHEYKFLLCHLLLGLKKKTGDGIISLATESGVIYATVCSCSCLQATKQTAMSTLVGTMYGGGWGKTLEPKYLSLASNRREDWIDIVVSWKKYAF